MNRLFLAALILFATSPARADNVLSYNELEAVAKHAIAEETDALNAVVADYLDGGERSIDDWRGYKRGDLIVLGKFNKRKGIHPSVFQNRCLLTQKVITAISAEQVTEDNLAVTANLNSVNSLRPSMGDRFFRIAERACLNARERFVERLKTATASGASLNYSDMTVRNVAHIVFFPAEYARPTLGKALLKALPIVINATLFVKGLSAFTGWAVSNVWLSVVAVSGPALTLKNLAPRSDELFKQREISTLEQEECIHVDLTGAEKALVQGEIHSHVKPRH